MNRFVMLTLLYGRLETDRLTIQAMGMFLPRLERDARLGPDYTKRYSALSNLGGLQHKGAPDSSERALDVEINLAPG
ncbi:MAG: hypothetical protein ND866_25905 [Pyrinomonadaceae bacterium]|nr:hypothetical protein [Pyrinomonadaceae bacterium]